MDLTSQMINLTIGVLEHNNSDDAFSLLLFMLNVYMFHGKKPMNLNLKTILISTEKKLDTVK